MPAFDESVPTTKFCEECGREYPRPRYASGKLQPRKDWLARHTCGNECGTRYGNRLTRAARRAKHTWAHDPCVICGAPIEREDGERAHLFRRRRTCRDPECRREHHRRQYLAWLATKPTRTRRPPKPRAKKPTAPPAERRTTFDRFPNPDGARPAWSPILDAAPPLPPAAPTTERCRRLPRGFRAAIEAHPEFEAALAGALMDSWMPFHLTSGGRHTPPARRPRR